MSLALEELPRGAAREELHEESQKTATNKPHTNRTPLSSVAAFSAGRATKRETGTQTYIYNYHTLFFFTASRAESKNTSSWSP